MISDHRGKNFASLPPASASANKNTCTKCKSYCGVTDGSPLRDRIGSRSHQSAEFLPPHRCRSLRDKRKTPASSDTGASPTSITCSYYSSSGRSIRLSVKYAPVGSSCEPLRTLSAEPSKVKVSVKSPFILTASRIESNSTIA